MAFDHIRMGIRQRDRVRGLCHRFEKLRQASASDLPLPARMLGLNELQSIRGTLPPDDAQEVGIGIVGSP